MKDEITPMGQNPGQNVVVVEVVKGFGGTAAVAASVLTDLVEGETQKLANSGKVM